MSEQTEVKSENARHVILSYNENVYFVNKVNVKIPEGKDKLKAVFHARRITDNQSQDLNVEISQDVYDVLVEYAKMNKLDLILVLQIDGDKAKWCLMNDNWFTQQTGYSTNSKTQYIV
ncbi:MAG: hypothetical protein N3D85_05820 [Candidatus Bathyarchaeota archaeon]|nr:hypothetical protein [Candidatus Bathyarchaeota archaeon]